MRRRDFIAGLGAAAWPMSGRAQERGQTRRVGVLMPFATSDPQYQARVGAFRQRLEALGWVEGRNVKMEYRASTGDGDEIRKYATDLVALGCDVILATGVSTVGPLQQATRTVPIVFAVVPDPVGAALSTVWRGRAETPPAFRRTSTPRAENG